jgi:DNA-binding NarL/FixJ family response regulator
MVVGGRIAVVVVGGPRGRVPQLVSAGVDVVAVRSGADAVRAGGSADVVVVDLGQCGAAEVAPVVDGLPRAAVLAVWAPPASHDDVLAAVRAGAAGVVDPDGVVDAVARLARGETAFSPDVAALVLDARGGAAGARLTERELDVLALVVEGLTARQIATRLVLSPRTVENHVQAMLRKLRLSNRAALVRYAIENGLA